MGVHTRFLLVLLQTGTFVTFVYAAAYAQPLACLGKCEALDPNVIRRDDGVSESKRIRICRNHYSTNKTLMMAIYAYRYTSGSTRMVEYSLKYLLEMALKVLKDHGPKSPLQYQLSLDTR